GGRGGRHLPLRARGIRARRDPERDAQELPPLPDDRRGVRGARMLSGHGDRRAVAGGGAPGSPPPRGAEPPPSPPSYPTLARPTRGRLLIFAVAGPRVRGLVDGPMPAGEHRLTWDGTNDRGRPLGSGAYFFRLEADGSVQAKKLILLR